MKFVSNFQQFPGPVALPILGNSLMLLGSQADFFRLLSKLGKQHKDGIFRLYVGMRPFVFLYKADVIQPLVNSNTHLEKNFEYTLAKDWLGNGLITSKGDKWFKHRKLLTSCFHFHILKNFVYPIWQQSTILVDQLKKASCDGKEMNIMPFAKLCALDVICDTAMGCSIGAQLNCKSEYALAVEEVIDILCRRFISPWLKPDWIFKSTSDGRKQKKLLKIVHGFVEKVVKQRKQEFDEKMKLSNGNYVISEDGFHHTNKNTEIHLNFDENSSYTPAYKQHKRKQLALLDYLLQASFNDATFTEQDILDEVNTFLFAGHETITSAISFTLFLLGHHKTWQDRIVEEIDSVYPNILNSVPDYDKLKELNTLDRCIKESLRLYPSGPLVGRSINTPLETPRGTLPVGTTAVMHLYLLHRDETVFPNADQFDPDRFLPENKLEDPYSYIPFSAGSRNCMGKKFADIELKIILSMVLKKFIITSLQKESELNLSFDVVLTNVSGIKLRLTERQ